MTLKEMVEEAWLSPAVEGLRKETVWASALVRIAAREGVPFEVVGREVGGAYPEAGCASGARQEWWTFRLPDGSLSEGWLYPNPRDAAMALVCR